MTVSPPPGWYADPDGVPGLSRWWDGRDWTAMTLPAPARPTSEPDPGTASPPRAPVRWPRYAVAVVLVGLLVVAATRWVVDPGRFSSGASRAPTTTSGPPAGGPALPGQVRPGQVRPQPSFPPLPPPLPTAAPTYTTTRIVDPAADLSYPRPDGPWQRWNPQDMLVFGLGTAGVFQVTQRGIPGGGVDRAVVVSGPLLPVVAYTGPADLPLAARQLAESLELVYYPRHTRRVLAARPVQVDGAPGYLVRSALTFDPSVRGYAARGAQIVVVVVDTGRPAPGVLYLSVPDTHRGLWPDLDRVVGGLHVIR